jgi:hypothetical protein
MLKLRNTIARALESGAKVTVGVVRCDGAAVEGLIHQHQCFGP